MGLLLTLLASVAKRRPVEFLNCTVATLHVRRDELGAPFVTRTRGIPLMTRSSRGAKATSSSGQSSTSFPKARRYGLHEAVDTEELLRMFDEPRASKVIPRATSAIA